MAQIFQVLLVCDLHGDQTPGTETVSFAVDGSAYEIDVCDSHAAELKDAFSPYVAAGRRAGRGGGRRRAVRRPAGGVDPAAVRSWARANNVKVSERGRISAEVLDAYAAKK
jgi:Lsr2